MLMWLMCPRAMHSVWVSGSPLINLMVSHLGQPSMEGGRRKVRASQSSSSTATSSHWTQQWVRSATGDHLNHWTRGQGGGGGGGGGKCSRWL